MNYWIFNVWKALGFLQLKIFNVVGVKSLELNTLQRFWSIPSLAVVNVTKSVNRSQGCRNIWRKNLSIKKQTRVYQSKIQTHADFGQM